MWRKLKTLTDKPTRLAVGLMSGTSADGIDAAVVRIHGHGRGTRVETLAFTCEPHDPGMTEKIFASFHGNVELICELNFALAESFARAAATAAEKAKLNLNEIDFIASHGQTAYHIPPHGTKGSTLQIGDGNVIAQRTGCVTICDFRTADMAAGGEGAPLVPLADYYLFQEPGTHRVAGNIGGIANVTKLDEDPGNLIAFDTGPGNMLIDAVVQAIDPAMRYDNGGALAARGSVDPALLKELMAHEYFTRRPPKTTGRELFGVQFAQKLLDCVPRARWHDLAATVTAFTAESLARGIRDHCGDVEELVLAGGGIHNPTLMRMLAERLCGVRLRTTAEFGVDPDAREAIAFAILGNETLHASAGNVPSATGAARGVILGKVCLP